MIDDFSLFTETITNNLEFRFKQAGNYTQSYLTEQHRMLNELILKDTKE